MNTLKYLNKPTTKFSELKPGHLYLRHEQGEVKDLNSCGLFLFVGKATQLRTSICDQRKGYLFLNLDTYKIHSTEQALIRLYKTRGNDLLTKEELWKYAKEEISKVPSWCKYVEYEVVNRYSQLSHRRSIIVGEIENIVFTEEELHALINSNNALSV